MTLRQCLLTNNDCYKASLHIIPKGIMVHDTAAGNPYIQRYVQPDDGHLGKNGNANDWNRGGIDKCVHAFIGKVADGSVATYQTLEWDRRGWHAGGAANNTHISFEICDDAYKDAGYFSAVYREAVELTAHLCGLYGLDPLADGVVIGHYEGYLRGIASNHGDPKSWFAKFGKSMDTFRRDVAAIMKGAVKIMGTYVYKDKLIAYINANAVEIGGTATPTAPANPYKEPPADVKSGSTGDGVKWVQWHLKRLGYKIGVLTDGIDGSFGSMTVAAVKAFQKDYALTVDGVVGAKTRTKLKEV